MLKNQQEILQKLQITDLNPMQKATASAFNSGNDLIILSPTGTGKTVAFLLPILSQIDNAISEIQVLIIVPTRELALQIELVLRDMGTGHKVNAIYGGRAGAKDKVDLQHSPAILIGTPGRIADHMSRGSFKSRSIHTLVLDEYDKSLEIGFESEMKEILDSLPHLKQRILTSATKGEIIPKFLRLDNPEYIDFLKNGVSGLRIEQYLSKEKSRISVLLDLLINIEGNPGIVFCNQKDTLEYASRKLNEKSIAHVTFHGDMEQRDRERALIQFRNGSRRLMLATDLAARGIDVPALQFILHYEMPQREQEFIHRNGRTARMHSNGAAYILVTQNELLPDYIHNQEVGDFQELPKAQVLSMSTLFISGGRKDKISKGDIAGTFIKIAGLRKEDIGTIEIKQDCAFVAVSNSKIKNVLEILDNTRIKKKKVRISQI